MCGIAGYYNRNEASPELLRKFVSALKHRGPDQDNVVCEKGWGLAHARLSIVDLSKEGIQPIESMHRRVIMVFNGEIYNYRALRKRLEGEGYVFRSNSDSEVLVNYLERFGLDGLMDLNGIFSFAYLDRETERMYVVRDPLGVKPLYYSEHKGCVYFGSEVRALLEVEGINPSLDEKTLGTYFHFLWVPGNRTNFSQIYKLEPGCLLELDGSNVTEKRWFDVAAFVDGRGNLGSSFGAESDFPTVFGDAVQRQFQGDVKIGSFVSGGLDSSAIVLACREAQMPLENFYHIFYDKQEIEKEGFVDDRGYAHELMRKVGGEMKEVKFEKNDLELLPKVVAINEEMDADLSAISTYKVCRAASEDGCKVLLSGTGGDEIMFGYRSHRAFNWRRSMPDWFRPLARMSASVSGGLLGGILGQGHSIPRRMRKLWKVLHKDVVEAHLKSQEWCDARMVERLLKVDASVDVDCFSSYYSGCKGFDDVRTHSWLMMQTFLASHNFLYTDKCSMAFGIEARVPLCDLELLRWFYRCDLKDAMENGEPKSVLKNWVSERTSSKFAFRPKTGFSPPVRAMIANDCKDFLWDILLDDRTRQRGLLDVGVLQRMADGDFDSEDIGYTVISCVVLELWCREYLD